jgi:hypothetical protein
VREGKFGQEMKGGEINETAKTKRMPRLKSPVPLTSTRKTIPGMQDIQSATKKHYETKEDDKESPNINRKYHSVESPQRGVRDNNKGDKDKSMGEEGEMNKYS